MQFIKDKLQSMALTSHSAQRLVPLLAAASMSLTAHGASKLEWRQIDDEDGIKIYRREVAGTNLLEFRGVGVVPAAMPKIVAILSNVSNMPLWVNDCRHAELVEKNFDENNPAVVPDNPYLIYYAINKSPWPLEDRDYVIKSRLVVEPAVNGSPLKVLLLGETVEHGKMAKKTGLTRIPRMQITIKLNALANNSAHSVVDFAILIDPEIMLPDAIINLVTRQLPLKTLTKLAQLVPNAQYSRNIETWAAEQIRKATPTNKP